MIEHRDEPCLKIHVDVGYVSGDASVAMATHNHTLAEQFLRKQDHEGSVVGLSLDTQDVDLIYAIFRFLDAYYENKKE